MLQYISDYLDSLKISTYIALIVGVCLVVGASISYALFEGFFFALNSLVNLI